MSARGPRTGAVPGVGPRPLLAGSLVTLVCALILGMLAAADPVPAEGAGARHHRVDPRRTRGLFADTTNTAAYLQGGPAYRAIWKRPQALWLGPEYYPTDQVRGVVRGYATRAEKADKTPMLVVYGIPDRDCHGYSAGGLPGGEEYRAWVRQIAAGARGRHALLVLEPDAIGFIGTPGCADTAERLALLRYASRVLSAAGIWVYLDAAHSAWTPYADRPRLLRRAGIRYDRGFSTDVSNFRPTGAERTYAGWLLSHLRALGIRGKHYVVDTSRNGARPLDGEVINPAWARVGASPKLVFDGAFDGRLWVKHPGESDGDFYAGGQTVHSGQWCDQLADRLLGRTTTSGC